MTCTCFNFVESLRLDVCFHRDIHLAASVSEMEWSHHPSRPFSGIVLGIQEHIPCNDRLYQDCDKSYYLKEHYFFLSFIIINNKIFIIFNI